VGDRESSQRQQSFQKKICSARSLRSLAPPSDRWSGHASSLSRSPTGRGPPTALIRPRVLLPALLGRFAPSLRPPIHGLLCGDIVSPDMLEPASVVGSVENDGRFNKKPRKLTFQNLPYIFNIGIGAIHREGGNPPDTPHSRAIILIASVSGNKLPIVPLITL
jgi:hypothetical protein